MRNYELMKIQRSIIFFVNFSTNFVPIFKNVDKCIFYFKIYCTSQLLRKKQRINVNKN